MFQHDIICALSGGGFRAAFFHAGVLRALIRLGLKDRIKVVSSVSGGSITNALFGIRYDEIRKVEDYDCLVLNPLSAFSKRNPRNILLQHRALNILKRLALSRILAAIHGKPLALFACQANSEIFMEQLDEHIFGNKTLADLSKNLRVILNAANLNNGARFRFDNLDFGDYKTGYSYDVYHIPISFAVMSSACFPGLFSPIRMDIRGFKFCLRDKQKHDAMTPNAAPDFVYLSDGGVFDNLGYYSLMNEIERGRKAFILISDAANRFQTNNEAYGFFSALFRIKDVLMEQVSNRDRSLIMDKLSNGAWSGRYFKMENSCRWYRESLPGRGAPVSELPEVGWSDSTVSRIARIRTDLDEFTHTEIQCLVHHGETVTETAFARWHNIAYKKICAAPGYLPPLAPRCSEKEIFEGLKNSHKNYIMRKWN